jgi:membrane protein YqaA with SNARE-associated domain
MFQAALAKKWQQSGNKVTKAVAHTALIEKHSNVLSGNINYLLRYVCPMQHWKKQQKAAKKRQQSSTKWQKLWHTLHELSSTKMYLKGI